MFVRMVYDHKKCLGTKLFFHVSMFFNTYVFRRVLTQIGGLGGWIIQDSEELPLKSEVPRTRMSVTLLLEGIGRSTGYPILS